ncbi:MAG: hypothetical protein JSS99_01380 [Actinobacteria bacterium]|nr:hypothetical protein [Actinomycetota bacterium]
MRSSSDCRSADAALADLSERAIEAIARRVVELLRSEPPRPTGSGVGERLLTAAEVARWWGVERSWVYQHALRLGVIRLGDGPRPRLRFDPALVARRLGDPKRAPGTDVRRSARIDVDTPLLPILGEPEVTSNRPNENRPDGAATPPATAPKDGPSAR